MKKSKPAQESLPKNTDFQALEAPWLRHGVGGSRKGSAATEQRGARGPRARIICSVGMGEAEPLRLARVQSGSGGDGTDGAQNIWRSSLGGVQRRADKSKAAGLVSGPGGIADLRIVSLRMRDLIVMQSGPLGSRQPAAPGYRGTTTGTTKVSTTRVCSIVYK
jgi:hypothetical protein